MNLFTFIAAWYDERNAEKAKVREHELELKRMEIQEIQDSNICQSCQSLRLEIARLHDLNNKLVDDILQKPVDETKTQPMIELGPKKGTKIPWAVRRQMLEQEDRAQARIIRDKQKEMQENPVYTNGAGAAQPNSTIEELEKELEIE